MELLVAAFIAGILTVLAPCILPLLPLVLAGSARSESKPDQATWKSPVVITVSLGISIILFTLLLKATTALLGIPASVWSFVSGTIIILLGISFIWPEIWEKFLAFTSLGSGSQHLLAKSSRFSGFGKDIATGFALGPVFNSCSPTYLLIVASVLPASFFEGFTYLLAYTIGLCGILLIIAFAGQSLTEKLKLLADPHGRFKRVIGLVFLAVGLMIIFGLDKRFQVYVLERGWYAPISNLEQQIRQ